jgi:hypothetical protein
MEIGKSATKAIVMLLSGKMFYQQRREILNVVVRKIFWPHMGFCWPSLTKNPGYTSVALISKELDLVPKYHIVEPT